MIRPSTTDWYIANTSLFHLRLVGAERPGGVQDAGIDLPAGAGLQPVGPRQEGDAVVALVPVLEAAAHVLLGGARLEAHEGVREVVVGLVVLRREVVRLGLAAAADQLGLRIALVHVMRDRAHVVEELAEQVPARARAPSRRRRSDRRRPSSTASFSRKRLPLSRRT